ncbi:hypothetical protein C2G38_2240562 [Gigaspora rosea]|uniref:Uncharacterized protein n=1 Tax=Gigaspora rosea TaxID=44941 RepID=A0A397VY86_9GLOM|nr:hypothetical protein C2G38_2240562 [Gigaspora rosea]
MTIIICHQRYIYVGILSFEDLDDSSTFDIMLAASKYPNVIFGSEYFKLIPENALVSILERDDLKMKKWKFGIRLLNIDTLQHCLPHIRYFHISGDDVVKNIRPYKRILEKDLWKDLSNRLMTPNCPTQFPQ